MEGWVTDDLSKYNLKTVFVGFSEHALTKNIKARDIDRAIDTVRTGKIVPEKSDKTRKTVCFKRYFEDNMTYLVVTGLHEDFLRIVTIIKVGGRI